MIRKVWLFLKALPGNLRKLFTSLSFLRIRNSDLFFFQWFLPSCISILIYVFFLGPFGFPFDFDHRSIFHGVNGLVGILIGFYIAALAATATFPNEKLDNELSGSKNIILVRRKGILVEESLTRRRFMTSIFGYCASISIAIFVMGVAQINVAVTRVEGTLLACANDVLFQVFWFVYLWMNASLICATFVGLHYLVDRMHRD